MLHCHSFLTFYLILKHFNALTSSTHRYPASTPVTHPLPHVISKIESVEALVNFDSILEVSDAIMVARGENENEVNIVIKCVILVTDCFIGLL